MLLYLTFCYISHYFISHLLLYLTFCYISYSVISHLLLYLTFCYISPFVISHIMLYLIFCYISHSVTVLFYSLHITSYTYCKVLSSERYYIYSSIQREYIKWKDDMVNILIYYDPSIYVVFVGWLRFSSLSEYTSAPTFPVATRTHGSPESVGLVAQVSIFASLW